MSDQMEQLRAVLGDRYSIERELGSGGMATVYLAEDRKHKRGVAIKVLHPTLAHTIGTERFLREIEVIARLQHPHILTLIDSGDIEGLPYYVMPYVEGESLEVHVASRPSFLIEEAVTIVREVADGLHHAHQHGVIHRDIKPANILMSGGHAMISDFGIATALEYATMGRITETGISLGSPLYMSPEQAAGERDLDARTDIYSLGCVLYELLSGTAPIAGGSMQAVVTKKMLGEFAPLSEVRADVPPGVDAAVSKALATQAVDRFDDARAFSDALTAGMAEASIGALTPTAARGPVVGMAVAVLVVVALAVTFAQSRTRSERRLWAAQQLNEIERLTSNAQYAAAFVLALELESVVSGDTTLNRLKPEFTDFLPVRTEPPGANVYVQRYDAPIDEWELAGVTPIDSLAVPKMGNEVPMRLKIVAAGYRTVEFLPNAFADWAEWRNVFPWDPVPLDPDSAIPPGMVRIPGFSIPDPVHDDGDSLQIKDYFMDRFEVTNREYKVFVDAGGYRDPAYWTGPFVKDGRELMWEEAVEQFTDQTGRPGPSTWRLGAYLEGEGDLPVGGVSWYEAAAYARFVGKEVPSTWHWARAARRFSRETSWVVTPNSNLGGPGPRRVGEGRGMSSYGLYDVTGNVREWNANPMEGGRVTRGAAWSDPEFEVGWQIPKPEFDRHPTNGFRLMEHFEDDTTYAHVTIERSLNTNRDYRGAVPAADAEYRIYRRLYDYEATALNATVDTAGSTEHYDWEKVTFDPAYEGRRAGAYIFLPKNPKPPLQSIVYWPGSGALNNPTVDHDWINAWTGFISRSGRVLVLSLYNGTFERDDEDFSIRWGNTGRRQNTSYYRDFAIQWIKDLGVTIDYLQTRDDFDPEAIGFYGFSWGGQIAPIVLAVEERIRVAVLDVGGLWVYGPTPLPEVEPLNFLPRVTTPTLMVNGRHDQVFPYELAQVPFFQLLGTAPEHKEHYAAPTAHLVPRDDMIRRALDWYDRYLGIP